MNIGTLTLKAGAGLAPMAGVSDMPFRRICQAHGASWAVSEMLSAKGFLYAPDARATRELIVRSPEEGVLGLQLFGHEPDLIAEAANQLESGFDFIDLNMGCPAHKIIANGDGSALMKRPELAGRIVDAVVRRVRKPVTVKLRAGWDEWHANGVELCRIAQDHGAAAVALHGRTRDQFYTGQADWTHIARAARALNIPLIGNGDLFSGADALRMLRETGCAGLLVGRGARGNPWLFGEIAAALSGAPYVPPTFSDRVRTALLHLEMEVAMRGEVSAVLEMRKHVAWYLSGEKGCAKVRARINLLQSAQGVSDALTALLDGEALL